MSSSLLFWVLMLLWLVFGLVNHWPTARADWRPAGGSLILFLLLLVLGWHVFGAPIQ